MRLCFPSFNIGNGERSSVHDLSRNKLSKTSNALIAYLTDKLRLVSKQNDTVASAMLGAWICELILHEKECNRSQNKARYDAKLVQFLANFANDLDPATTIRILSSHDASAFECAEYAAASGDIGTAINAVFGDSGKVSILLNIHISLSPFSNVSHVFNQGWCFKGTKDTCKCSF